MRAPNRNTLWARVLVDELARSGLCHATMAPGSRSTPIVLAMARHEAIDLAVHVDERSAAFHALGAGKATGQPAAVVTTSGTATANLHPAVVEADQSHAPLLVLTADRPRRLRGADANQAIDQIKLFGDSVRSFHDVVEPTIDRAHLRHLRQLACRALGDARAPHAGPVHLNLPFHKPLEPTPVPGDVPGDLADEAPVACNGRPAGAPFVDVRPARTTLAEPGLASLADLLSAAKRPLVVAGPHPEPDRLGSAALALARALHAPLLADPLSGARLSPRAPETALGGYDLFLRDPERQARLSPDLVVRVGATPTSKHLAGYLARHGDVEQIVIDDGPRYKDHLALATRHVAADAPRTLAALAERVQASSGGDWTGRWRALEQATREVLDDELLAHPYEAIVLARAAETIPEGGQLFVGNSMPVRDLDATAAPRDADVRVLGNRGASGIDGLVSTAVGAAAATPQPTVAVIGDLSLLHDINGLHALERTGAPLVLVVVNNDGGGIFHHLPIREHEGFTDYFATPHGRDLTHVAALHERPHERLEGPGQAPDALEDALTDPRGQILEVPSDRNENQARHEAVAKRVQAACETIQGR